MTRYIDADNFRKTMIKRFGCIPCLTDYSEASRYDIPIDDALNLAPTADVVPKSEVERLERICHSYALQYGTVTDQQKVIDKAKAEVAREIFAEIEEMLISSSLLLDCTMLIDAEMLAELKKKYQEGE